MLLFAEISYNGKNFHGWQKQPNAISVQEEIEKAFNVLLREDEFLTTGCGRTDAGVHASQFYFHFETKQVIEFEKFVYKVNTLLPKGIAVRRLIEVPEGSHARFDAVSRTYQYFIHQDKDPFLDELSLYLNRELNVDAMNEACEILPNLTDFTSFSKVKSGAKTNNCIIQYAKWTAKNRQFVFEIKADRFLRNMVRAIVGTMIEVGQGKISVADFKTIIENKNRCDAGTSVSGHGLFLTKVSYPYISD